jgi:CHAT domain-containing protein
LSSCSSGGATGSGRGEWLGLSTVCLLAGARSVVGTAWPIPDTPGTLRLEEDLLQRLTAGEDPATALRACQLPRLAEWQAGHGLDAPIVWASFQCIGVY